MKKRTFRADTEQYLLFTDFLGLAFMAKGKPRQNKKFRKRPDKSLERRKATKLPGRRFYLYCEGRNTEPRYFSTLKSMLENTIIIEKAVGVPLTIAEAASNKKQELDSSQDSHEENDEVWAVFDRDEHPKFDEAVALCEMYKVGLARSNPCFEIWLILHIEDFDKACDRDFAQKQLKKIDTSYNPKKDKMPDCNNLIDKLSEAEKRAAIQLKRRSEEGNSYGPPSTTVHLLTRALKKADKKSLHERLKQISIYYLTALILAI